MRIVECRTSPERRALAPSRGLPAFDAAQLENHAVDLHLCALSPEGDVRAHCSLWWRQTPQLFGHSIGAIGHFGSVHEDATHALLNRAVTLFAENGCSLAVGPMDGNTWRRYRFVTAHGSAGAPAPPFFLEPANPLEWPKQFESAGFSPLAEYYSALNSDLSAKDPRLEAVASRFEALGVRIRPARVADLMTELKRIYQVSRIAFRQNFLYTELPEIDFLAQYTPLLDRIRPELILLAEREDELVGYLFGVPDFAQAARGSAIDTFILKTAAILPEPALRGLGGLLVGRAHEVGHHAGFRNCIHALMHADNVSRKISAHYAVPMRRYTLYSREIAP